MSSLNEIKSELRFYMNGALAQSLRERGLRYRLIFGVELPRLKEIAARHTPDHDLAQALWKEDIRECRILAGYLQPVETFLPELADIWLEAMHDTEIIDYTCMNLFRRLPYAQTKAFQWIALDDVLTQYAGFRLMCHLLREHSTGQQDNGSTTQQVIARDLDELTDHAEAAQASDNSLLRQIAHDVLAQLRHLRRKNGLPAQAQKISDQSY